MTNQWKVVKIGDICKTGAGGTPLKSEKKYYEGGAIPWLLSGEVCQASITSAKHAITERGLKESSAKIFPPNTVIVAMYGATAGQVGILRIAAATNQAVCGIYPNDHLVPEYLYYALLFKQADLVATASGNAQPNISQIKIRNTEIPLPSVLEQKRIVAILDEAFAGIATAIANTEKNLANARELFESYLNSVFGRSSENWIERKLGEIADFKNGLNFTKNSKGEHIRIVGVKDFKSNFWVPVNGLEFVQVDGNLSAAYELEPNDLLIVRSNGNKQLIGRCIVVGGLQEKTSYSGFTIRVRLRERVVASEFLAYYLKSNSVREKLVESGDGANISSLNQQALASLAVTFPSIKDQHVIIQKIEEMSAQTKQLETIYQHKLKALNELKQSLLQKAFSGELTAKVAQELEAA